MKRCFALIVLVCFFTSCNVTESIVFNDDGSGEFLVNYDMGKVMTEMGNAFSDGADEEDSSEKKEAGKVMDTMMVFSEIMETYKDSVAALPEDKRLVLESLKDMYMKMHMDEDKEIFEFGVGLNFKSIEDLQGIQEKIKKAQSLNAQNDQVDAMKEGSPIGKYMGTDNKNMQYLLTENSFSRITNLTEEEVKVLEDLFDEVEESDESDKEFMSYFDSSFYNVRLTFPKKIKSTSIEGAVISEDGKTLTYKTSWMDYIKNPKLLDVSVQFVDE